VSPTFFTDRDLGQQFPDLLHAAGLPVVRHSQLFAPDAADEEWLARVGDEEWLAVTHDRRIRYKPNELAAVERHRVALLAVVGAAPFRVLAENFVTTLSRIEAFVTDRPRPFIGKVYRAQPTDLARDPRAAGRVELWYPR
jgi:hypothetical protein